MKSVRVLCLAPALLLALSVATHAEEAPGTPTPPDLTQTGADLDRQLFDAFNRCDLEKFGAMVDAKIEFYHDKTGLMLGREAVLDATRKNICGKVRRELVESSLQTFPMQDYGLLQLGNHRFCEIGGQCVGVGRFVHLWHNEGGTWRLTRIYSYDHQPLQ